MTTAATAPAPSRPERALWGLTLAAAAAAAATFLVLAAQRVGYPYELEWMEGALVDHAARVAQGRPIYCLPTPEHVPFLYAPLQFWLGGALIACGLDGLLALRLVGALASLGVAALIGHWVRRETGRVVPGLVASGVFLAGYGWLMWWYDLARNDSPFLLAVLGCAWLLRHGGRRRWLPAAVLAVVAVLAKQSAVMWLPAIGVGALLHDLRNGLRFCAAGAAGALGALGLLHLGTDGWSTFYLFEMPSHHDLDGSTTGEFFGRDLWRIYPLLALGIAGFVAGCGAGRAREALFLAAFGAGGLVTSWLSRLHIGGYDNVLMYGFAAACVLGPCVTFAGRLALVRPALLAVQLGALLAITFAPGRLSSALPSAAHEKAHEELLDYVRAQPREVFLPGHGLVTARAGKPTSAHGQAIFDLMLALPKLPNGARDLFALGDPQQLALLPARSRTALVHFRDGMLAAMQGQRYSAIVLDEWLGPPFEVMFAFGILGPDMQAGTDDDLYRRRPGYVISQPKALRPLVGFLLDSPFAYEAR